MELDLGGERFGLEILLLFLCPRTYVLAQAAELKLEGRTWIWFEARILVPERAGLRRMLRIICGVRLRCWCYVFCREGQCG